MAQNSPEKLRVVIISKEKFLDRKHSYAGKVLAIPLISGKNATVITEEKTTNNNTTYSSKNKKYTVVIDAGHGGRDGGASCCGNKKEKKVVLSVAKKLEKKLQDKGYKVYMTRSSDSFVKLPKRTEFANKKKADIFVSIHANAAPKKSLRNAFKGIEIYYLSPAKTQRAKEAAAKENSVMFEDKDYYTKNAYLSLISREKIVESHKLGIDVSNQMLSNVRKHFGSVEDGGVKTANFWVLVGAQMPAILVETGYITHPKEGRNLMNNYYRSLLAQGIADGIGRYLKNK
ncbi:MAG: N-acetylmuramoyl-L-alanine amidase (EC [uncultured Sulfurovum sp.]|uniref:N-acetylmuramoyl-L-alanine amidase n=1 Tax=uncultured Sulfurovum sp. TaxID=269237 RepID=A0A6S6S5Z6_9BACT|nr:MAG: N-acetylmuramoyl-L-alanine amidase (EC [uncultured Sulfurovum sp.]